MAQAIVHVVYNNKNIFDFFFNSFFFYISGLTQISESFKLVIVYIFNGAYSIFYLMHHKLLMNIVKYGVRICEGSD